MKRGKRCFVVHCFAAAPFASPAKPDVHACENHKKRDFVNMRNKRCLAKGCYRNPHYGVSRLVDPNSKAQYCTQHKAPGMQNVNGGRCAGPDCSKQPRFSLPGHKGKYCSKHRGEGMVDVLYTPCAAEGCKKHPHFGFVEGGPRYCAQHRAEGMVDVKHRRCAMKGCRKDRVQITAGTRKRGKFCEIHTEGTEAADNNANGAVSMEQDAASSEGPPSERRHGRMLYKTEIEDDGAYMSSESSQIGSSMGDAGSGSYDYPSGRSARPITYASSLGQVRSVVYLERERTRQLGGETAVMPREEFHGPSERDRHYEILRHVLAPPPDGGSSDAEIDQGEKRGAASTRFYDEAAVPNPYPLYQRDKEQSSKPVEDAGGSSASTTLRRDASSSAGPIRPFRLRYGQAPPDTSDYSWYPCPWEFTREGQRARMAGPPSLASVPGPGHERSGQTIAS